MTNFIQTDQRRSTCVESASLSEANCTIDTDCQNKPFMSSANGRWTGRCLFSSNINNSNETINMTKQSRGLCEIQGNIFLMYRCIMTFGS